MVIDESPDYVSLSFDSDSNTGTIDINPGFGSPSGNVTITATNSESASSSESFFIYLNHYPVFSAADTTVYILGGDSTSFIVELTDIDEKPPECPRIKLLRYSNMGKI